MCLPTYKSKNRGGNPRSYLAIFKQTSLFGMMVAASILSLPRQLDAATSASQWGITWSFSEDRPTGRFANGDWWVVGPVTIVNINPKTGDGGDPLGGGSMVNPIPGQTQGFYGWPCFPAYDISKNVSLRLPITIQPGSSLYSTVNNPDTWAPGEAAERAYFKETAILTILPAAPPVGSFRPPWAGTNKTIKSNWNVANLNYAALRSLAPPVPANVPNLKLMESATQRPLMEMDYGWPNSQWKAVWRPTKPDGFPNRAYGREVAHISAGAGLLLNTNLSNAAKEKLLINMVQWGIDNYGLLEAGMQWWANGGHQNGRLLPTFIAGKVLNDPDITARASSRSQFQELSSHQFIAQADIDRPRKVQTPPLKPYSQDQLGMPEWSSGGQDAATSSEWNNSAFWASGYRFINGSANSATVATILLMGGRGDVKQEAFFRYVIERFYPMQKPGDNWPYILWGNSVQPFTRDMWDTYIGSNPAPPVDLNSISNPSILPSLANYFADESIEVRLVAEAGAVIRYTTNGSNPTATSSVYSTPFKVATNTTVKASASKVVNNVTLTSLISEKTYQFMPISMRPITKTNWTITANSQEPGYDAIRMIDGRDDTFWHTKFNPQAEPPPYIVSINLGATYDVTTIRYQARIDSENGRLKSYKVFVSSDGVNWGNPIVSGAFLNSALEQVVTLPNAVRTSLIRMTTEEAGVSVTGTYASITELGITGTYVSGGTTPPIIPPSSGYIVGNRIQVAKSTWVNSTASIATPIGSQPANSYGTIVEGPVGPGSDGITWFRVNYDTGADGFSGADNFTKATGQPPAVPPAIPTGLRVITN